MCVTGQIEDEFHVLSECYLYDSLRKKLFDEVKQKTGYNLDLIRDQKHWIADALIGHRT